LNASDPVVDGDGGARRDGGLIPRRWTLHGLNNGLIFTATYYGVSVLPRALSYAIGDAGTWLAWRLMRRTREAIADNLRAILPDQREHALERRALLTLRAYARDIIDFIRAIRAPEDERRLVFDFSLETRQRFQAAYAEGRGVILVAGHYGNWEIGSLIVRRALSLPLTIVAMPEVSPAVNRIRQDMRRATGADTLMVRHSLDTALQIKRRLNEKGVVAMLTDRHVGRDRVRVTLLGRDAWFLRTPALMGLLTGAPLVPSFIERTGSGRFEVITGTAIHVSTELPREEAIRDAAQRFADQLGERARLHPHYWYHFYRYWDAQRESLDAPASGPTAAS
jgi:KDO2-lipid IV(A) lauroyltransferase